ncbi:MAG: hypothetical protein NT129_06595, partial [Candidatus Aenigmarchaeota archaeon]|nr:hypothetical protein [Candidatus Aenigmarchaeota archaeon]
MKGITKITMASLIFVMCAQITLAQASYQRPCGDGIDLCTWNPILPLGSENCCGCNLNYNTYWPLNTDTSSTCTFSGDGFHGFDLYLSINNDIISCTLNGVVVFENQVHEGCAPEDPRNGYQVPIT